MNLQYQLDNSDYVQALIFYSRQNSDLKKRRNRSWVVNTLAIFSLSFYFWTVKNHFLTIYFLIAGVIVGCIFPFYTRWRQKRFYTSYIANMSKDWERQGCKLQVADGYLEMSDNDSWSKLAVKKIQVIHEVTPYFFIRLKAGSTIIIPKNRIEDIDSVRNELVELGSTFNIPVITDLKWSV